VLCDYKEPFRLLLKTPSLSEHYFSDDVGGAYAAVYHPMKLNRAMPATRICSLAFIYYGAPRRWINWLY